METCLLNKRSRSSIKKINWWGNSWWTSFFRDKQVCGYEIISCLYPAGHIDETILSSWLCYQVSKKKFNILWISRTYWKKEVKFQNESVWIPGCWLILGKRFLKAWSLSYRPQSYFLKKTVYWSANALTSCIIIFSTNTCKYYALFSSFDLKSSVMFSEQCAVQEVLVPLYRYLKINWHTTAL